MQTKWYTTSKLASTFRKPILLRDARGNTYIAPLSGSTPSFSETQRNTVTSTLASIGNDTQAVLNSHCFRIQFTFRETHYHKPPFTIAVFGTIKIGCTRQHASHTVRNRFVFRTHKFGACKTQFVSQSLQPHRPSAQSKSVLWDASNGCTQNRHRFSVGHRAYALQLPAKRRTRNIKLHLWNASN